MKNLLTKEAFAEWCASKPADEGFNYMDCKVCACGQYASYLGLSKGEWTSRALQDETNFWRRMNRVAIHEPHTFGALAERLRA